MAQVVTGNLSVSSTASETVTNGLASGTLGPSLSVSLAFTNGTGTTAIQYVFSYSETLAISTPRTWTLSALTDSLGRSVPFAKVRSIVIANLATVDGYTITVGGAASNPWLAPFADVSDKLKVPAGGCLVLAAPLATAFAVTASSSDQLKLDPGANAVAYKILISGE